MFKILISEEASLLLLGIALHILCLRIYSSHLFIVGIKSVNIVYALMLRFDQLKLSSKGCHSQSQSFEFEPL